MSKLFKQMKANKPIKIFVDCHKFDEDYQGITSYIKGLYNELSKDENFHFYFASSNSNSLKKVFGEASNITYLDYFSNNKWIRLLIDIPLKILKYKIDFAHFQYIVPPIKNCKYIVSTHDVLFLDYPEYFPKINALKNKWLYYLSAKKSDIVLTGSQFSKEKIQKHFNINNVYVTVYGVEPIFFEKYNKDQLQQEVYLKYQFDKYIIYTSRHEPRKNHYRLLKAFIELKLYLNYHLVLIGDVTFNDKNFDKLLSISNEEIKNKVVFLNKVDFKSMILLLRAATLSVYPSIAEGFGLPPLESVAAEVPTLCSNKTSMVEFTFFGDDFIDPLNQEDINTKILSKLSKNDSERQNDLSNFVANKYNWSASAKSFLEILN